MHNSRPPFAVLQPMNPVHTSPYLINIFNIILPAHLVKLTLEIQRERERQREKETESPPKGGGASFNKQVHRLRPLVLLVGLI
jgi:hypothetical protein